MATLLSGIALLILSGLTVIAYRHPDAYAKMHGPLWIGLTAIVLVGFVWFMGVTTAHIRLIPVLGSNKLDEAKAAIDTLLPPFWPVLLSYFGLNLYLGFLRALPSLLGMQKPHDAQNIEKHE